MALTAYQREMEAEISEGVYHRIFLFADGIVILCACVCAWSTYRTKKELLESAQVKLLEKIVLQKEFGKYRE